MCPSELIPIQKGAEVKAQDIWADFINLQSGSGVSITNTDTVDGIHAYYHYDIQPNALISTDDSGYLPTGIIPPAIVQTIASGLFVQVNPALPQANVTADIQNSTALSTLTVKNVHPSGRSLEAHNLHSSFTRDVIFAGLNGISGAGIGAQYSGGLVGSNTKPLVYAQSLSGYVDKPALGVISGNTNVYIVDFAGNVTASGIVNSNKLNLLSTDHSSAPINVLSSGLNTNLNADYLDGHHWTDILNYVVSGVSGFVPSTGGTFTGPVIFDTTNVTSNTNTTPIMGLTGVAVTSPYPVLNIVSSGNQNFINAYYASGLKFSIDRNGNVVTDGYVSGIQVKLRPPSGLAPIVTNSSGWVENLNADYLDGQHASYFANVDDTVLTRPDQKIVGGVQTGVQANIQSQWYNNPAITATNVSGGNAGRFITRGETGVQTDAEITNFSFEIETSYVGQTWGTNWVPFNTENSDGTLTPDPGGDSLYQVVTEERYHANKSQRVIRNTNGYAGVYQIVDVVNGSGYEVSAWVKNYAGSGLIKLGVDPGGGAGYNGLSDITSSNTLDAWEQITVSGITATADQLTIGLYFEGSGIPTAQIENRSFEEGFYPSSGIPGMGTGVSDQLPSGWTPFFDYSSYDMYPRETTSSPYHGSKAFEYFQFFTTANNNREAGLYQVIPVVSGITYDFTGQMEWMNAGTPVVASGTLGFDPTGGIDPSGVGVVWGNYRNLPDAASPGDEWTEVSVSGVTATGPSGTLFLKGKRGVGLGDSGDRLRYDYFRGIPSGVTSIDYPVSGFFDLVQISGAGPIVSGEVRPAGYFENQTNSQTNGNSVQLVTANTAKGTLHEIAGIPPIKTNSLARNVNFNADMLDGLHASEIATSGIVDSLVYGENVLGADGITTLFSITGASAYQANTTRLYLNGLRNNTTNDYAETSPAAGTFTFNVAPVSGANITIDYFKVG